MAKEQSLLDSDSHQPKAQVIVVIGRLATAAGVGLALFADFEPAAAANGLVGSSGHGAGTPFPDVSMHVAKAELVWRIAHLRESK
jgi:hypothetical protein